MCFILEVYNDQPLFISYKMFIQEAYTIFDKKLKF